MLHHFYHDLLSDIYNNMSSLSQDPFLVISKIVEHGSPIPVSKTEVLKNESNPVWKPVSLSVQQVGSKVTREILVSLLEEEGVVTVLHVIIFRTPHW